MRTATSTSSTEHSSASTSAEKLRGKTPLHTGTGLVRWVMELCRCCGGAVGREPETRPWVSLQVVRFARSGAGLLLFLNRSCLVFCSGSPGVFETDSARHGVQPRDTCHRALQSERGTTARFSRRGGRDPFRSRMRSALLGRATIGQRRRRSSSPAATRSSYVYDSYPEDEDVALIEEVGPRAAALNVQTSHSRPSDSEDEDERAVKRPRSTGAAPAAERWQSGNEGSPQQHEYGDVESPTPYQRHTGASHPRVRGRSSSGELEQRSLRWRQLTQSFLWKLPSGLKSLASPEAHQLPGAHQRARQRLHLLLLGMLLGLLAFIVILASWPFR